MPTREELIAEINRLEELKAVEAEIARRKSPGTASVNKLKTLGGSLAKAGKSVWDNLARGAGNAVASATSQVVERDFPGLVPKSPMQQFSDWVTGDVKEKIPVPADESTAGKLFRKGTEAVGGGLVLGLPGLAKAPVAGLASLFGGGVGAEAGGTAGRKLGGTDATEAIGSVLGAIVGSGGLGMLLGPRLSAGESAINRNTQGLTPEDFTTAEKNLELFQKAGAKTATLPEAFEGRTSLLGLAENTRASKGGEALAARTAKRAGDLQELGQNFLNRVGPDRDPNAVAVEAVNKANQTKKTLGQLRTQEFGRLLEGEVLPQEQVFSLYRTMLKQARQDPNPDKRIALAEVAQKLLDEHRGNKPITDLQTLSLRVKNFKENPPGANAATGKVIDAKYYRDAVDYAEDLLKQASPKFEKANQQYALASANIDKEMSGGFGRLADANPLTAAEPTVNRLNPLFSSGNEQAIAQTLSQLQTPGPLFGPAVKGSDVVRAWSAQKLDKGSTNPGAVIRGLEGSSAERRIAAALAESGKDSAEVLAPLRAADRLQNFKGLPGMKEPPEMSGLSAAVRPHRTADFLLTDAARTRLHEEIARLMAPTPENLARLRELAQFDPNIRRMLIARGIAVPQLTDKD